MSLTVLVQSVWRGHQARRKAREEAMFQAMEVDEYASCKIQCVFRGHKARSFVRATRLQREYDRVFKAAAKLQGTWRGHCDRCFARDLRSMLAVHLQQHSALQLQRVYRGHIGRLLKRVRFLTVSANLLQAVWRGHVGRRQCSMKLRHHSAVLLQSVWRGHIGRCKFLVQSQVQYEARLDSCVRTQPRGRPTLHVTLRRCRYCHACATVIGRVYRGHLIRRYVHEWVVAARAALVVQSVVRRPPTISLHVACVTPFVPGPWPPGPRLRAAADADYRRSAAATGCCERTHEPLARFPLEVAQGAERARAAAAAQLARPLVPQVHA